MLQKIWGAKLKKKKKNTMRRHLIRASFDPIKWKFTSVVAYVNKVRKPLEFLVEVRKSIITGGDWICPVHLVIDHPPKFLTSDILLMVLKSLLLQALATRLSKPVLHCSCVPLINRRPYSVMTVSRLVSLYYTMLPPKVLSDPQRALPGQVVEIDYSRFRCSKSST